LKVELGVFAVFTGFGLIDKAVVVINHPAINLTGIDRFHHGAVAFIGHEVGFHRLEPFQGGLLALQASIALTMAWKSAPDGDAAQRPFHSGFARSISDLGSCCSLSFAGL
jgi:hypothetical protein